MLNPPPTRPITGTTTITEMLADPSLKVGDRVVTRGYVSKIHGIGEIVNVRSVGGINLFAVIFASSHTNEYTELQLRKV